MNSLRNLGRFAFNNVRNVSHLHPKFTLPIRLISSQSSQSSAVQPEVNESKDNKSRLGSASNDNTSLSNISEGWLNQKSNPFVAVESTTTITQNKPDKLYKTIELEILAYEPSVLDSYQWFVLTAASHLQLHVGKIWQPGKFSRHLTVANKSAHVHKKARVHYEVRTYHRFINLHKLTGSTADTFLEYIQRNLPEGVGLRVTKCEVLPLPDFVKSKIS